MAVLIFKRKGGIYLIIRLTVLQSKLLASNLIPPLDAVRLISVTSRSCQVDPIHRSPKKDPPTRDEKVKKEYKLDEKDKKTKKEEEKFAEEMKKKGSMDEQD
jgi:hypothetical protein